MIITEIVMMMMMVMVMMVMVMVMMMMMMIVIIYCKMIVEISGWWRYFCLIGHPTCDEDPFWPAFLGGALKSSTRE
jgi:hypothetical protein